MELNEPISTTMTKFNCCLFLIIFKRIGVVLSWNSRASFFCLRAVGPLFAKFIRFISSKNPIKWIYPKKINKKMSKLYYKFSRLFSISIFFIQTKTRLKPSLERSPAELFEWSAKLSLIFKSFCFHENSF